VFDRVRMFCHPTQLEYARCAISSSCFAARDDGIVVEEERGGEPMDSNSQVVEGINLEVAGTALVEQIAELIAWHNRGATDAGEELETIRQRNADDPDSDDFIRLEMRRRELARMLRSHEERARFLDFVHRHLNPAHTYRLKLRELAEFDITPQV
jgi:hypothetical protein